MSKIKVENIETLDQANRFIEGCLNDFEDGFSTKLETIELLGQYTGRLNELFWHNAKRIIKANPKLLDE